MNIKNKVKKGFIFFLCIINIIQYRPLEVKASDYWPEGPTVQSPAAIVMEASTGTVLYERNSTEAHYPASITKILTTLVALENASLDEVVTFSDYAIDSTRGGSGIARDYGEQMTLEQCLYGVMLESANECAAAVAEHVGGTMEAFIDMMNEKAKEIGCQNSHFANPHGLHDDDHYTCAYDMALIANAAYQNETFRIIVGTKRYEIPPTNKHSETTICRNHNEMLCYYRSKVDYTYAYCTGGKTGYTTNANSTLVTYAEKDGMTLICVVMNTISPSQWTDSRSLFDYCFDNFQLLNIAENDTEYTSTDESNNGDLNKNEPFVELDDTAAIVMPKAAEFSDAKTSISYSDEDAKIVGTITYRYADREVGTADIVTTGVTIDTFEFDNQKEEVIQNTEEEELVSTVQIKPWYVALIIVAVILVIVLIILLKRFFDSYYILRHRRAVKKSKKTKYKEIKDNYNKRHRRH